MAQRSTYLKVNDQVEVIAGKEKGSVGKVLRLFHDKNRALVDKVNLVKRHMKPTMENQQGGIIEKEAPIHVSNLMLICSKCAKPVRIGNKVLEDGSKARYCKKCGHLLTEQPDQPFSTLSERPDVPAASSKFKDPTKLTQWTKWFLYAFIVIAVVAIVSGWLEYQLLNDFKNGV